MPEHPRLYYLVGLADPGADDGYRILQGDARDRGVEKKADERKRDFLLLVFVLEPTRPAYGKMSTRWMCYHNVPPGIQDVTDIAEVMLAWAFRLDQVTGDRFVPLLYEGVPDHAGKFAGN